MKPEKVYAMKFAKVYPCLLNKALKKGRTKEEVDQVICWLTGYSQQQLDAQITGDASYEIFFQNAPAPNPNRDKITGVICGIRVEQIEDPLMREIRYLDKLIDELARGKSMEKIFRR